MSWQILHDFPYDPCISNCLPGSSGLLSINMYILQMHIEESTAQPPSQQMWEILCSDSIERSKELAPSVSTGLPVERVWKLNKPIPWLKCWLKSAFQFGIQIIPCHITSCAQDPDHRGITSGRITFMTVAEVFYPDNDQLVLVMGLHKTTPCKQQFPVPSCSRCDTPA